MDTAENLNIINLFYYTGKNCDNFEAVFNELFRKAGYKQHAAVDCLSMRCFAHNFSGSIDKWFGSLVNDFTAVNILSSKMLSGELKISRAFDDFCLINDCLKYFIIVCSKNFFVKDTLRDMFYPESCRTLLCSALESSDYFAVSDMMEHTYDFIKTSELLSFFKEYGICLVSLKGIPEFLYNSDIIGDICRLRQSVSLTDKFLNIYNIKLTRHSEITLRFGLMNYQIQMLKALNFIAGFIAHKHDNLFLKIKKTLACLLSYNGVHDSLKAVINIEDMFTDWVMMLL